ncbi:MAG: hypothetical protein II477_00935, partial [Lachnospiraceae bacterium]|nr:hypothetical protein [Lachnospiraceae bacterium]
MAVRSVLPMISFKLLPRGGASNATNPFNSYQIFVIQSGNACLYNRNGFQANTKDEVCLLVRRKKLLGKQKGRSLLAFGGKM